jgi:hypothetical protein
MMQVGHVRHDAHVVSLDLLAVLQFHLVFELNRSRQDGYHRR